MFRMAVLNFFLNLRLNCTSFVLITLAEDYILSGVTERFGALRNDLLGGGGGLSRLAFSQI